MVGRRELGLFLVAAVDPRLERAALRYKNSLVQSSLPKRKLFPSNIGPGVRRPSLRLQTRVEHEVRDVLAERPAASCRRGGLLVEGRLLLAVRSLRGLPLGVHFFQME